MFACIYIPDFPVAAIVRVQPELRRQAVAVLEGKPPLAQVIALNERARRLGIEIGMTKLQAAIFVAPQPSMASRQNRLPPSKKKFSSSELSQSAKLCNRSLQQEKSAHAALLDVAHSFTPRVEDTASNSLLLDLAGLERLYGSHLQMARALRERTRDVSIEANIAVAANPDAARHAARGFDGITVIPEGEEAQRLSALPVQVLLDGFMSSSKPDTSKSAREQEKQCEQIFDTLERWGVRDFRTLAMLPEHALAARLGETGGILQRLVRGAVTRTLALCEPATAFEESLELESPVETLEPLSFILHRLLQQLCARLEARALAMQELQLEMQLERRIADEENLSSDELAAALSSHIVGDVCVVRRTLHLPAAMRDPQVLLKLLQLELNAHPPGAPVIKAKLVAEPAPPRGAQRDLFLPMRPEAEKLEITLARIGGIVGEQRVGIASLLDTHRHEGFVMGPFMAEEGETKQQRPTMWDTQEPSGLALRIFRPACRLNVQMRADRPVIVKSAANFSDRTAVQGKIVWSAGPWRSSGDWWGEKTAEKEIGNTTAPFDREEWDIALAHFGSETVALYRIYRDLASSQWFADASYD